MDNAQEYVNFLGATLAAVFGWIGRTLWGAVQSLKKDLNELQRHIPSNYVTKQDFQRYEDKVLAYLERIESKLDSKMDKE